MLPSLPNTKFLGDGPLSPRMIPVQVAHRRPIILAISLITIFIIIFRYCTDVPYSYYQNYGAGDEAISSPTKLKPLIVNDKPQQGYFKSQPEWDFSVPPRGWKGYARVPRNWDVVVLTASDGGGHNSAIPNVLERVLDDRQNYCDRHGFTNLWLNTSRYDIGQAHRTWSKIPAVAEAFSLYPTAEWVWLLDTDIILMAPSTSIITDILAPAAIAKGLMRSTPILDGMLSEHRTNISTPSTFAVHDIDILITQDHQSVNTGSVFFRRTAFTRWILEMMTDYSMLMGNDHPGAEQDALKHLMLEHPLVRKHVGVYPQRKFNAYVEGGKEMGYRDGDLLVHMAGCWVGERCKDWFEEFWGRKGKSEVWKPEERE
ncbi:galactosyl transferase GMA12/MNN10 family-domain-containing protein [Clohesyomyces aquaticus]|uniref:Galactosyl transferase GMA12/MNN10 family-domain-containing protein n=1 Tax=Clohesyomyces aquaticus TaxID=1231657 RepID=A0A1Y1Z0M4_9PLEO|nr:galactosyl transferase GMA12/MNN10 family-domain-containing protein [Clohesyomyces aquaticus]